MSENTADFRFTTHHFQRIDESPDSAFYVEPRFVVHIDDHAIRAAMETYRRLLPAGGFILDLMSSWRSHLPEDVPFSGVTGLGLNAQEMANNPQLTEFLVQDLTESPTLPFADAGFDGAVCTVSVQYLTHPLEVFREVGRVLRPNAPFVVTFSNRCFPTKAVRIWRETGDDTHVRIVQTYFRQSGCFEPAQAVLLRSLPIADPLYAVWATRTPPT